MIPLTVTLDCEQTPWTDVSATELVHNGTGQAATVERVGLLRHGTVQGRATVELLIRLPDGTPVVAETTLRLAMRAAQLLAASPTYAEEDLP